MDFNELKKLLKSSTSVLILENGNPSFVVLDYGTYKDLVSEKGGEREIKVNQASNGSVNGNGSPIVARYSHHERETEILERLNKEILALKNQIEMEEKGLGRSN